MTDLFDICFQFRDYQVSLMDYFRFYARGTAHAECRGAYCDCVEGGDGTVAALLRRGVGGAGFGAVGFAAMAAGWER